MICYVVTFTTIKRGSFRLSAQCSRNYLKLDVNGKISGYVGISYSSLRCSYYESLLDMFECYVPISLRDKSVVCVRACDDPFVTCKLCAKRRNGSRVNTRDT